MVNYPDLFARFESLEYGLQFLDVLYLAGGNRGGDGLLGGGGATCTLLRAASGAQSRLSGEGDSPPRHEAGYAHAGQNPLELVPFHGSSFL